MARFDVHRNPASTGTKNTPFVLDVQADLLTRFDTRIVIPLRRRDAVPSDSLPAELMPSVTVDGIECVLLTHLLSSVPARVLGAPISNLGSHQLEIGNALDFVFHGF